MAFFLCLPHECLYHISLLFTLSLHPQNDLDVVSKKPPSDNQREEEVRGGEQSGVDGQCQTQTGRGGQKGTGQTTTIVSNSILFC